MAGREAADAIAIERVENQHNDRQIDERENESGVRDKKRRAAT
jgi:hypothetical protein